MMIVLGEAVGFVADVLEEAEGVGVTAEAEGFVGVGGEDFFAALGEGEYRGRGALEGGEGGQRGVELAPAAVY